MNKLIGIFICNYNKREFVVNCVKSVFEQTFKDFDLFIIDNASTDDSVSVLKEKFKDQITIIENKENLGGSGGFNIATTLGYEKGYKYIMLLDNDTYLDKYTVENLYKFLEENDDVGMVAPKIYKMQNPKVIQEFGGEILWQKYLIKGKYNDIEDDEEYKFVQDADYLAACCLMVKREVIDKIGFIDKDYFIYFDDVEWSYKCKLSGYRCCAIGNSKIWHNSTAINSKKSTFIRYYFVRNRLNFFARYIKEEDIEKFSEFILLDIYKMMVGLYSKKQYNSVKILNRALNDFIKNIRGRSDYNFSLDLSCLDFFEEAISKNNKICFDMKEYKGNQEEILNDLICKAIKINPNIHIFINGYNLSKINNTFEKTDNLEVFKDQNVDTYFVVYDHVMDCNKNLLPKVAIDKYYNCIYDDEIFKLYNSFEVNEKIFVMMYKDIFIETVKKLRKENE